MTQLFIGIKPNVGPVVKVLKYDTDDALTLANNAYGRYYFNSENQKLAMVRDQNVQQFNYYADNPTVAGTVKLYSGDGNTSKYVGLFTKVLSTSQGGSIYYYGRRQNIFTDVSYPPMAEVRAPDANGWMMSGSRELLWVFDGSGADPREFGCYMSYQYSATWVKPLYETRGEDWRRGFHSSLSFMGSSEWVLAGSGGVDGREGNEPNPSFFSVNDQNKTIINAYWDFPADSSPMVTYTPQPNLEIFRANQQGVVMSRPGYSVDSSAGTRHRILDSTINLASVVMSGISPVINAGQTIDIPSNLSIPMATTSVVEMMVKEVGEEQYIPPHILSGYAKDRRLYIQHKVNPYSISIRNNGTDPVQVTYVVFNIDAEPQTTGGNEIIRRVNIGGQDEIQIKKPFSSDDNPKVSDLILDTRFPTMQIIQEGFINEWEFTDPPENGALLGLRAKEIFFNNNGFTPFVKFNLVFEDRIHPPVASRLYSFSLSVSGSGMSRFSSLARLRNNSVKFWINTGSWSGLSWNRDGNSPIVEYWGPNPLGIRYYIFGITT